MVTSVSADGARVELVNLDPIGSRDLVIQAGAFGEHEFTSVETDARARTLRHALAGTDSLKLRPSSISPRKGMAAASEPNGQQSYTP